MLSEVNQKVDVLGVDPFDPDLVIFDCDGVLIDSEIISARTLIDLLKTWDIYIDETYVRANFLGRSFPTVTGIVMRAFGVALPEDFEKSYRRLLLERFETELNPMEGIKALLERIKRPFCLATSSSPPRLQRSLHLTGLSDFFEDRMFTASQVANGKPAPDLFLLAAETMSVAPAKCLVIEDSRVGMQAGRAAGMRVVWFSGGSHVHRLPGQTSCEGFEPDHHIARHRELTQLLPALAVERDEVNHGI